MIRPELLAAYRHHKPLTLNGRAYWPVWAENMGAAQRALRYARKDVWEGVRRYPVDPTMPACGARDSDGDRWCESPERVGLRLVGTASEVAKQTDQRLDHTGWYTRPDDYDSTLQGVIFRLPGKDKRARYIVGHNNSDNDGAFLQAGVIIGDKMDSSYDTDDSLRDAVRQADSFAEREAEKEREYNQAWEAGSMWASEGESIAAARKEALAILKERHGVKGQDKPALCSAIRSRVESLLDSIREARAKRDTLASGDYSTNYVYLGFWPNDKRLAEAFNDGAGEIVLAVPS